MPNKLVLVPLLLCSMMANAQDQTIDLSKTKTHKQHELGLIGGTSFGYSDISGSLGAQYKHWTKPNKAFRLNLSFSEYTGGSSARHIGTSGDTVIERVTSTQVPVFYLGGGIEAQRQFYKRVFLYAAIDAQVGYGRGNTSEVTTRSVWSDNSSYFSATPTGIQDQVTYFSASLTPYVGAKFQFSRISFGTEISAIQTELVNVNGPRSFGTNSINMDIGNYVQRVFVLYRL